MCLWLRGCWKSSFPQTQAPVLLQFVQFCLSALCHEKQQTVTVEDAAASWKAWKLRNLVLVKQVSNVVGWNLHASSESVTSHHLPISSFPLEVPWTCFRSRLLHVGKMQSWYVRIMCIFEYATAKMLIFFGRGICSRLHPNGNNWPSFLQRKASEEHKWIGSNWCWLKADPRAVEMCHKLY